MLSCLDTRSPRSTPEPLKFCHRTAHLSVGGFGPFARPCAPPEIESIKKNESARLPRNLRADRGGGGTAGRRVCETERPVEIFIQRQGSFGLGHVARPAQRRPTQSDNGQANAHRA